MPNKLINPNNNTAEAKGVLFKSGSNKEVNSPTEAKQINPMDTLDSLMLP